MTSFLLLLPLLAALAFANTEVVKYTISDSFPVLHFVPASSQSWPVLSQSRPDQKFDIPPALSSSACTEDNDNEWCQHYLWTVLDMTSPSWSSHDAYMLRVSWPAHFPTSFSIKMYSSPGGNPRVKYARIYAIVDGVFTPPNDGTHPFLPHRTASEPEKWDPVPFYLDLEPLYLGFLPESMIPVAICIVVITIFAYKFVVPPIDRYLQSLAEQARRELASSNAPRKED